ncbi:MAG TPA: hypothetical protein VGR35_11765 [Tepidisphaeraceae bacterium]|nr:hypothetical protein [Tepidisphaeraceae bacterium]
MSGVDHTPEMLVRTEDLMAAYAAVNRDGADAVLARLRAREPVIMKYLMENWDEVYRQLRRQPPLPEQCMAMRKKLTLTIVVALTAQSKAQYRLWRGTSVGTLLEQIDPGLAG